MRRAMARQPSGPAMKIGFEVASDSVPAFGPAGTSTVTACVWSTGQPLRDTGRLQRSITSQVQGDAAVVGTNVRYARTHQFGATILPKNAKFLAAPVGGGGIHFLKKAVIPSRPFMPLVAGGVQLPPAWARSALNAMAKSMGL